MRVCVWGGGGGGDWTCFQKCPLGNSIQILIQVNSHFTPQVGQGVDPGCRADHSVNTMHHSYHCPLRVEAPADRSHRGGVSLPVQPCGALPPDAMAGG